MTPEEWAAKRLLKHTFDLSKSEETHVNEAVAIIREEFAKEREMMERMAEELKIVRAGCTLPVDVYDELDKVLSDYARMKEEGVL